MTGKILIATVVLFAFCSLVSLSLGAESVEASFGADGAAVAYFFAPEDNRLFAGLRVGLGFEWTDFILNDPSLALAVRYALFSSKRWAWWVGVEVGAAYIDTSYARFAMPFAGASIGARFRIRQRFSFFLETGGRFGQRDLTRKASLDFLDARYKETIFIDPLVMRFGLTLNFPPRLYLSIRGVNCSEVDYAAHD